MNYSMQFANAAASQTEPT